ncbi:MAG: pyridoxamine 5'-phosphate oxidase family protein [Acidimicrobiales bacterium]|nr:pyridoxamine 5'-phosphate oxidase family protein [Acidimicrobiales bacterium]
MVRTQANSEPTTERPDMEDYGVPSDLEGTLPWHWASERLVRNRNYWVVTADRSGRPHSMPVWGVWRPDVNDFWFSCSPKSRKARNVAQNPAYVVTVDDTVECVSVEGRARIVDVDTEATDLDDVVSSYLSKYWEDPTEHAEMEAFLRSHTVIAVTPERAFGVIERADEFSERATRWSW